MRKFFLLSGTLLEAKTASAARLRNYYQNINPDEFMICYFGLHDYFVYNALAIWLKDKFILRLIFEFLFSFILILKVVLKSRKGDIILISSPPFSLMIVSNVLRVCRKRLIVHDIRDLYPQVFVWKNIIQPGSFIYKSLIKLTEFSLRDEICIGATHGITKRVVTDFNFNNVATHLNGSSFPACSSREEKLDRMASFTVIYHGTIGQVQSLSDIESIVFQCPRVKFKFFTDVERIRGSSLFAAENAEINTRIGEDYLLNELKNAHLLLSVRDESELTKISNPVKIFDALVLGTPAISIPKSEIDIITRETKMLKSFTHNEIDYAVEMLNNCSKNFSYYERTFPDYGFANKNYERPKVLPEILRILM